MLSKKFITVVTYLSSFNKTYVTAARNEMCTWLIKNETKYNPDTLDLNSDKEAAKYWFPCFRDLIAKTAQQAANSNRIDAKIHAEQFSQSLLKKLEQYEKNTIENGKVNHILSIRELLESIDVELRQYGFIDPWEIEKQSTNNIALSKLETRIIELDNINDFRERWTEIFKSVIAGNMFDSGAQAVTNIIDSEHNFGLKEALNRIQPRPWLIDDLDAFIDRMIDNKPHKCAAIFVDNSGIDIILGILPFARELLKRGTKVILCANSAPSLNDVTAKELTTLFNSIQCSILKTAWLEKKLLVHENGQRGPCLDMRNLPQELCDAFITNEMDLLVIEGMGRAVHTNLNAKFNCETLKLAVVKNRWLAERLGGKLFSTICKYESNIK